MPTAAVLALMPGHWELLVLLIIGLLIFGRRLPEVGRQVGKTLVQFRRGVQDFKSQLAQDDDLRDVKATVHEMKRATEIPREMTDPKRILDHLEAEVDAEEQAEADAALEPGLPDDDDLPADEPNDEPNDEPRTVSRDAGAGQEEAERSRSVDDGNG